MHLGHLPSQHVLFSVEITYVNKPANVLKFISMQLSVISCWPSDNLMDFINENIYDLLRNP